MYEEGFRTGAQRVVRAWKMKKAGVAWNQDTRKSRMAGRPCEAVGRVVEKVRVVIALSPSSVEEKISWHTKYQKRKGRKPAMPINYGRTDDLPVLQMAVQNVDAINQMT